jgi:hypothetical protein
MGKKRNLSRIDGHRAGIDTGVALSGWPGELDIGY